MSDNEIERLAQATAEIIARKEKPQFYYKIIAIVVSAFISTATTAYIVGGKSYDWVNWRTVISETVKQQGVTTAMMKADGIERRAKRDEWDKRQDRDIDDNKRNLIRVLDKQNLNWE